MSDNSFTGNEIAVIGISGRFPKSHDVEEYWKNIVEGNECITFFSEDELLAAGIDENTINKPNYVKAYGYLDGADQFDNEFFQYTDRDGLLMDPQMRLLHEVTWETLEDAGYNPDTCNKKIGLYLGASDNLYWQVISTLGNYSSFLDHFATSQINNKDFLATQIAYKLNLKGPAVTIATACSTSLVTIHMACQALLAGDCEIALAGGATVSLPVKKGYIYEEGMILSPDGHCRSFDVDAAGIVGGSGVGVVALKLLEDAIEDGDHIHAVIRGSAINNDGHRKVSYSSPSVDGQIEVIRLAQQIANVKPETISYIETHGTATRLGDTIEMEALTQAFHTKEKHFCGIGSVKSNIGHVDVAAGIAGFIKAVLMLEKKVIPPAVNFHKPNPHINFENSPFYITTEAKPWNQKLPFRVGISSFGIGGTNAHVILEEAPKAATVCVRNDQKKYELIPLSAQDSVHLIQALERLKSYLQKDKQLVLTSNGCHQKYSNCLRNIAYTLQMGRKHFLYRTVLVVKSKEELINSISLELEKLKDQQTKKIQFNNNEIVFMFPGQGSLYINMGAGLLKSNQVFRENFNKCIDLLTKISGKDYREILIVNPIKEVIYSIDCAQLYIFSFEYSLAKMLMNFGILPTAMIGHSLGEYVAACLSGVFTLEEALYIIVKRGKLMETTPTGAMLSIQADEQVVRKYMNDNISIGSLNSLKSTVISGACHEIDEIKDKFEKDGICCVKLHTSRAFHSKMMDGMIDNFKVILGQIHFETPKIPFISSLTGTWITPEEAMNPEYWCRQLRNPVQFAKGLDTILSNEKVVLLEVGPGTTLTSFANDYENRQGKEYCPLNLVRHIKESVPDEEYLLKRIGHLWSIGINVSWKSFLNGTEKRVSLPVYPFHGKKFMIHEDPFELMKNTNGQKEIMKKKTAKEWFYLTSYQSESISYFCKVVDDKRDYMYILFLDNSQFSYGLKNYCNGEQLNYITVAIGETYKKLSESSYEINPKSEEDYNHLFESLKDKEISNIIHAWTVMETECEYSKMQIRGFYSLLHIAKAFNRLGWKHKISLTVVSNGLLNLLGTDLVMPSKGTICGAMKVIPQEQPYIRGKLIDIDLSHCDQEVLYKNIILDSNLMKGSTVVGFRGNRRWVQTYTKAELPNPSTTTLNSTDVIVITGGLGKLGKIITKHLISTYNCKLALLINTKLPEREKWESYLHEYDEANKIRQSLAFLLKMEETGAEIVAIKADIRKKEELSLALEKVKDRFGHITGIIHAAGRTDFNITQSRINDITLAECGRQMDSKVLGVMGLEKALAGKDIKFCILFSSLASVIGGLGYVAYSAANSFLDAYANKMSKDSKTLWLSVNWDNWNAAEYEKDPLAIEPEEGTEVLDYLLSFRENQVLVSTYDLEERINRWVMLERLELVNPKNEEKENNNEVNDEDIDGNNLNYVIKNIMEKQLGKKEIGIDDNFFELGGDSLKALSIISMIQKKMNKRLLLSDFFLHPTIRGMVQLLNDEEKEDDIPRVQDEPYYRICSSQERLYMLNQLHKESTNYNLPQMMLLEGFVDSEKLKSCFQQLVHRHEALRASFHYIDGEILQTIHGEVNLDFQYFELGEEELKQHLESFIRAFNLEEPCLMRAELIKIDAEKYLFMLDFHHIISDGGSFKILFEELSSLYQGEELPTPEIRYRDYCEYENSEVYRKIIAKQKNFWFRELGSEIPELILPTDYLRKDSLNFNGASIEFHFDSVMSKKINYFVLAHNTTKFVFFLATFNILLLKLSNQQDIIVGTPVARRSSQNVESIFGHFLNVLPLRNYPTNNKTFEEFFIDVSENTVKAFENQDFSYKSMVESLNLKWSRNRNPLFDVMLIMQNIQSNVCKIPSVKVTPYKLEGNSAKFDLTLEIFENEADYKLLLEYCSELFSKNTIEIFIQYYKKIITYVIEKPDCFIEDIKLSENKVAMENLSIDFDF